VCSRLRVVVADNKLVLNFKSKLVIPESSAATHWLLRL